MSAAPCTKSRLGRSGADLAVIVRLAQGAGTQPLAARRFEPRAGRAKTTTA